MTTAAVWKTGFVSPCGWAGGWGGGGPADCRFLSGFSLPGGGGGGWDIDQSVILARQLKEIGVDLIDCSSGFAVPDEPVPFGPGFQVPFAARVRAEAGIASGAVGFITEPFQAEQI